MATARRSAPQVRAWLGGSPSLTELRAEYPAEWTVVERELMAVVDTGDQAVLAGYVRGLAAPRRPGAGARAATPGLDAKLAAEIRRRMAAEAIRGLGVRAATGVAEGTVRFGKLNGMVAQRLLFSSGLTRKPVSNAWFRAIWPLLGQRRRLMPLVQPRGIYCFYSRRLVRELAALIGDRPAVEIAAGDGTLARFLRAAGADVTATDDHSWAAVAFPEDVRKLDAAAALRELAPRVVLCSWPPAGNPFEAEVFRTDSVELYVVIGNRNRAGWGDQDAYAAQEAFGVRSAPELAALVLPPELESEVLVFERRMDGRPGGPSGVQGRAQAEPFVDRKQV